jgi:hypothetical protein
MPPLDDKLTTDVGIDTSIDAAVHDLAITVGLMSCELGISEKLKRSKEVMSRLVNAELKLQQLIAQTSPDDSLRDIAGELNDKIRIVQRSVDANNLQNAREIAQDDLRNIALAMRDYRII